MRVRVQVAPAERVDPLDVIDTVMAKRYGLAVVRIKAGWPPGRSQAAWRLLRTKPREFVVINDARHHRGPYAAHVHHKGQTVPLSQTLVPSEIGQATAEFRKGLPKSERFKAAIKSQLLSAFAGKGA